MAHFDGHDNDGDDGALLHAWLDGELGPSQRAQVDAWLRDHPEDAARVRAWAADREALRGHFEAPLEEPVPEHLAHLVEPRPQATRPPWLRWAAAVAVFLVGGVAGGLMVGRLRAPQTVLAQGAAPWAERAVVAHAVYVPEQRHPVEVDVVGATHDQNLAQEQHLQRWLTKRLDLPVKLFDLRAQGYELIGGRLLPDASGPSAQLMYQQIVSGQASAPALPPLRVTVYLRKPDAATPASFRYEQHGDLGMFYWVEGQSPGAAPTGYALVGALSRDRLLALAEAIYRQGQTEAH